MAYNAPDLNDYLPGEPWTSAKALLTVENPIAFIDQDSTSPVNQAAYHPYDKVTVGDGNDGVIWDHSATGNSGDITSPVLDAGYRYLVELTNISFTSPLDCVLKFYDSLDNLIALRTVKTGQNDPFSRAVDFMADDYWRDAGADVSVSISPVSYFKVTGGTFNGGKIYLRRRKELI